MPAFDKCRRLRNYRRIDGDSLARDVRRVKMDRLSWRSNEAELNRYRRSFFVAIVVNGNGKQVGRSRQHQRKREKADPKRFVS